MISSGSERNSVRLEVDGKTDCLYVHLETNPEIYIGVCLQRPTYQAWKLNCLSWRPDRELL